MPTYGKYNPGTYWGKGYGLGDLGEIASADTFGEESPLEFIRSFLPSSSSKSSSVQSNLGFLDHSGIGSSGISPASAALLSAALKQGAGMAGVDPRVSSFIPAITSAMSGNTEGVLRNASGAATGVALNALDVPAPIIGPVASFISSYAGGDKASKIAENVENSALGSILAYAGGPAVGTLYNIARMVGLNPARGINNLINPDTSIPESWRGGFIDKGYDTQPGTYVTSGNENYSPYGGAQYERVAQEEPSNSYSSPVEYSPFSSGYGGSVEAYTPSNDTYFGGINTGGGNNYQSGNYSGSGGSSSGPTGWGGYSYSGVGSSSSSGGYSSDSSDSDSSYSNPASSYGGW